MALRTLIVVLALTALTAACGSGEDRPGSGGSASGSVSGVAPKAEFDKADATTTADVQAVDYAYTGLPASVQGPNVYFTVKNTGHTEHEFEVVGADGEPVSEIPAFGVNETKTLAVKLAPGTYTVQCLIKEGSKTHAELGMKATLAVT